MAFDWSSSHPVACVPSRSVAAAQAPGPRLQSLSTRRGGWPRGARGWTTTGRYDRIRATKINTMQKYSPNSTVEHGYIYLMRLEECINPWQCAYKVGRSYSPETRSKQIGIVLPYDLKIIHEFWVRNTREAEQSLHQALAPWHLRGEWFWPEPQWVNWFRSLSQYYLDTGEYPSHEPNVHGRTND